MTDTIMTKDETSPGATAVASTGVVSAKELLADGYTRDDIRRAHRDGNFERLRTGWYALPDADATVADIVRAGSVVSCVDSLERHGIWVPEHDDRTHSRTTRYGSRRHGSECRRYGRPTPTTGPVDDVPTALQYAARCLDDEGFIIVCDSAANEGLVSIEELRVQFAHAPKPFALLDKCDARAQSGTETATRVRLRRRGFTVTVQHHIPTVGHVDLLVGELIALELDSRAHHTGEEQYEYDRARDRRVLGQGYLPVRLTYRNVFHQWNAAQADILRITQEGRHRSWKQLSAVRRRREAEEILQRTCG